MSESELSDAPSHAIPSDATLETELRRVVRDALKQDEDITVRLARVRVEEQLGLETDFFTKDEWKKRSKDIITAAVDEPESPVKAKPKAGRKRKSDEPAKKPTKRAKKSAVVESDDDDDETVSHDRSGSGSGGAQEATTARSTSEGGAASSSASVQPSWMKALRANALQWLTLLPTTVTLFGSDAGSVHDPLYRFWAREHRTGSSLLCAVRNDLQEVVAVCDGDSRQTNHNRTLLTDLPKAVIPQSWRRYSVPKSMTLAEWIVDLRARLEQLERITREASELGAGASGGYDMAEVVLGLLFSPGAYLTATRQSVAHASNVSLENLSLRLLLNDAKAGLEPGKFAIRGLKLQGANWDPEAKRIKLNDGGVTNLGLTALVWEQQQQKQGEGAEGAEQGKVRISVYLNQDRSQALFATMLDVDVGVKGATVAQRAVALRAS